MSKHVNAPAPNVSVSVFVPDASVPQESAKPLPLKKLRKKIRKAQKAKRYEHTLGVEYTSAALAMRYGANLQDAVLAGLLHDCAKCLSNGELLQICESEGIPVTSEERKLPYLLHGKVGSFFAKQKYGVQSQDVLNAVLNHTTGRENMSLLEKIVFVADYIEPGRDQAPDLESLRKLAFEDLDQAVCQILKATLAHLETSGSEIDPRTLETYRYYEKLSGTEK